MVTLGGAGEVRELEEASDELLGGDDGDGDGMGFVGEENLENIFASKAAPITAASEVPSPSSNLEYA
jgi:hypothetical protein